MDKKTLQGWAEDVDCEARKTDQCPHDALIDLQERSLAPLNDDECKQVMAVFDDEWD